MTAPSWLYLSYLASREWHWFRDRIFAERGRTCERCGSPDHLDLHHKTYVRLGRELPEDVEILCAECHAGHHGHDSQRRCARPLGIGLAEYQERRSLVIPPMDGAA